MSDCNTAMCALRYHFFVQRVLFQNGAGFQLRIGLEGDKQLQLVPAYRTAFATKLSLKEVHRSLKGAEGERDVLTEWLRTHVHGTWD